MTDPLRGHDRGAFLEGGFRAAGQDLRRHHLRNHRGGRILSRGHHPPEDVALGEHAHHLAAPIDDDQAPDAVLVHGGGGGNDGVSGKDGVDAITLAAE